MSLRLGKVSRNWIMETLTNLAKAGRLYLVNTEEPFNGFKLRGVPWLDLLLEGSLW